MIFDMEYHTARMNAEAAKERYYTEKAQRERENASAPTFAFFTYGDGAYGVDLSKVSSWYYYDPGNPRPGEKAQLYLYPPSSSNGIITGDDAKVCHAILRGMLR